MVIKEVIDPGDPATMEWYRQVAQPIGPLYVTGCRHGVRILRDAKQFGFIVYHGDNREAQMFFSDRDFDQYGEKAQRKKLIAWLHEIHEYEGSNAVVSHV